jgi:pimeloyl-ACP methyl ester carboxylesterase
MPRRGFAVLATLVAAAGLLTALPPPAFAGGQDFAGPVDIGGRSLYLECRGRGSPTVVLEAGYRSPALVWTEDLAQPQAPRPMVFASVAPSTRVCTYDRPGTAAVVNGTLRSSRSDPVPMPRTATAVVADLHALLRAARVPGPYVLVGHSLGGLFVQLYASTYPAEVVGLVLVDALPDDLQASMTPAQWASYVQLNTAVPPELAHYPDYEVVDFGEATAALREAQVAAPLRRMPLYVLTKGRPWELPLDPRTGFSGAVLERAWAVGQAALAALLPGTRQTIATDSDHYIMLEQPDLVADAIGQVVEGVGDPGTWFGPPAQIPR